MHNFGLDEKSIKLLYRQIESELMPVIRTKSDRGVVAVLDPRITTRHYGKSFLNDLPECRYTSDINAVKYFFNE